MAIRSANRREANRAGRSRPLCQRLAALLRDSHGLSINTLYR